MKNFVLLYDLFLIIYMIIDIILLCKKKTGNLIYDNIDIKCKNVYLSDKITVEFDSFYVFADV